MQTPDSGNPRAFLPVAHSDGSENKVSDARPTLGIQDCVLMSERGAWCMDTEVGVIDIISYYYDDPLPLCINNAELADWYVNISVLGGYEPTWGYIDLYQKGVHVGTINVTWTYAGHVDCYRDYWMASFYTSGNIELDSNQYPDVHCPWWLDAPYPNGTIPGKEVCLDIWSFWRGCFQQDQHFTILSAH